MLSIYAHFSDIIHFQLYTVILMAALFYKVYWIHAIYDQFYTLNGIIYLAIMALWPTAIIMGISKWLWNFTTCFQNGHVKLSVIESNCNADKIFLNSWVIDHPPCIFYKQLHYGTLVGLDAPIFIAENFAYNIL